MSNDKPFDPNDPCLFCNPSDDEIIAETEHAWLIKDCFPVSPGHCLVIPKRHIRSYFDSTPAEAADYHTLIQKAKSWVEAQHTPDGYNIGCNNEEAAGQSVFHLHIHVIPRYRGDVENPRGGVRNVVPKAARYDINEHKKAKGG